MKPIHRVLANLRVDYISKDISMEKVADNPIEQFESWIEDAIKNNVTLVNAMHFATVGNDGRPSGRIMLLRGFDERGFVFFSNHRSRKGIDLENNKFASMTFFWNELFRQVRIEGDVHMVPDQESDKYFESRPRESQISAVASEQSMILESRESLEKKVLDTEEKYLGKPVPRPVNWGGYYLSPMRMEFWQGRERRLHDRILYIKGENSTWTNQRLYP